MILQNETIPPSASQPLEPTPTLTLQVVRDFAAIEHLEGPFDSAVERLAGPIYMSFGWLKVWWRHYGDDAALRVYLFWHQSELVGIIPCYIQTLGAGPLSIRIARLVGANVPPKTFNPPLDPRFADEAVSLMIGSLFGGDRCHLLSLGPVSRQWPAWASFRDPQSPRGAPAVVSQYARRDVHTVFKLPATVPEYLEQLEPSERKSRMKRLRQLERSHRISEDVISDATQVKSAFEEFSALHAQHWKRMGRGGHFEAWPQAEAYNLDLVLEQARHGRVRFYRLLADDRVISSRYTYRMGGTLFSELPARAIGEPWDKLGIGVSSLIKFTGQAINEGVLAIDSGLGSYEHKSSLGGDEIEVGVWRVFNASWFGRVQARLCLLASQAMLFVFQKLWYRRILPRLPPGVRRTQGLYWLRYDY